MSADVFCPHGHVVQPSRLSVAKGMWFCGECCTGGRNYYRRDEVARPCADCAVPLPPEGDCLGADGRDLCSQCILEEIPTA